MFKSTIDGITIPVLIPKRNKGHIETACTFKISSNVYIDQLLFIPFIMSLNGLTLQPETLSNIAKKISKELKLDHVEIHADFSYPLDRVSVTYTAVLFNFRCGYTLTYDVTKDVSVYSMSLSQPIRLKDFYSASGNLYFSIEAPDNKVFFEDLIDHIQKQGKFVFYPPVSIDDIIELKKNPDSGVFHPYDVLVNVQDACRLKDISKKGHIGITFSDVYTIYNMNYELSW